MEALAQRLQAVTAAHARHAKGVEEARCFDQKRESVPLYCVLYCVRATLQQPVNASSSLKRHDACAA